MLLSTQEFVLFEEVSSSIIASGLKTNPSPYYPLPWPAPCSCSFPVVVVHGVYVALYVISDRKSGTQCQYPFGKTF